MTQKNTIPIASDNAEHAIIKETPVPKLYLILTFALGIAIAIVLTLGPAMVEHVISNDKPFTIVEYWWAHQNLNERFGFPSDAIPILKDLLIPYLIILLVSTIPSKHQKFYLNILLLINLWLLVTVAIRISYALTILSRGYSYFHPTWVAYTVLMLLIVQVGAIMLINYRYFRSYFKLTTIPVLGYGVLYLASALQGSHHQFRMYTFLFFIYHELIMGICTALAYSWRPKVIHDNHDYRGLIYYIVWFSSILPLIFQGMMFVYYGWDLGL